MKFKPGDEVVRIFGGAWGKGRKATIVRKCPYYESDYVVKFDPEYTDITPNWHEDSMELEEVYNSPLYQALK